MLSPLNIKSWMSLLSFSFFSTLTSCWLIKVHPLTTHFHDEKNKIKFRTRKWAEGKIGGDSRVDIQHKTTDKHQRLSTLFPRDLHFHLNSFSSSCFYIEMFIKKSQKHKRKMSWPDFLRNFSKAHGKLNLTKNCKICSFRNYNQPSFPSFINSSTSQDFTLFIMT